MTDIELIKKYVDEKDQEDAFHKLKSGYPVQYIIGHVDFYDTKILVNESVLIPRFETEYLVEKTINYIKNLKLDNLNILEIGTGSGAISIALKKNIDCLIEAIDISENAINMARKNALLNNTNISFFTTSIEDYKTNKKFNIIISNPPYVPIGSIVDPKTKYEPQNAIFAKDNGLYFYKIILEKIKDFLETDYLIAFEIGDKEGESIEKLAKTYLKKSHVKIELDYNNYERYVFISNKIL